ncbi:hypothetical protein [Gordonia neofelifaecis]|uniref:Uncharacterized protein n=1 Tax=Gordonia neofelifaecis NRRL B-59395 TaxID=644548 RepID=F1YPT6_9ACTN|nr:hypothetical protein [Gordonia neofelifaecis]EGD53306.1 hypothetical protein SCNU_19737 [Gordonia neofelifaecis NRRL B-59395]
MRGTVRASSGPRRGGCLRGIRGPFERAVRNRCDGASDAESVLSAQLYTLLDALMSDDLG